LLAGFEEQIFHLLWVHHNSEAADSGDVLSGLYDGAAVGRYSQLVPEVMHTEVGSVHSQALGLDSEVNGLQQRVSRRLRL
jgi:hypothetical protein